MGLNHLCICRLEGVYHFCPAPAGRSRWFEGNQPEEFPQETHDEMAAAPSLVPPAEERELWAGLPLQLQGCCCLQATSPETERTLSIDYCSCRQIYI